LILYLDPSALVKLHAEEAHSAVVRRAVAASDLIATSLMSYAEARSALARKCRGGEIARAALNRVRQEFERDWARLHVLPVDEPLVRKAGDLTEEHALRAVDALHLATADDLQAMLRAAVTFVCFDDALNGLRREPIADHTILIADDSIHLTTDLARLFASRAAP
jgi:uncharacterized protein